ncbi:MAG: hypothetical protein ABJA79_10345 [Parafilimonas sp.]
MIKNEKQYKISKKRLAEVVEKINKIKSNTEASLKQQLVLASIESFKTDLEKEIKDYDVLKLGKSTTLKERSISELPRMIIEYKILNNLTHREFSQLLGLKEQQLQRYESENFKTVSFQNLIKFINRIDLDLKVRGTITKSKSKLRRAATKHLSKV